MSEASEKLVAFETLGCRSNYADTVELEAKLVELGAKPCSFEVGLEAGADVYVLNTCTVTDSADKTVYKILRKIRSNSPEAKIVVTGCMAEVKAKEIKDSGLGDIVLGPGQKQAVIEAILTEEQVGDQRETDLPEVYDSGRKAKKNSAQFRSISLDAPFPVAMTGPGQFLGSERNRSRYHLRVQEGCENSCTFCIIPQTRGRFSTRSEDAVLNDIEKLSELGYEEVVLTGTHLGGYGIDSGSDFFSLLKKVAAAKPKPRIRLSSIDPNDVSKEIVDFIHDNSEVFCPHLHICIQAFCERTLKRMNRLHTLAESVELVDYIYGKSSLWCIGSDLIAGFPGETREEFDSSLELFESLPIAYLHVFPYSERENTAATSLDGEVSIAERKRRAARFRAASDRKRIQFLEQFVGDSVEVVLEQLDGAWLKGTSREYASVRVQQNENLKLASRFLLRCSKVDSLKGELVCER